MTALVRVEVVVVSVEDEIRVGADEVLEMLLVELLGMLEDELDDGELGMLNTVLLDEEAAVELKDGLRDALLEELGVAVDDGPKDELMEELTDELDSWPDDREDERLEDKAPDVPDLEIEADDVLDDPNRLDGMVDCKAELPEGEDMLKEGLTDKLDGWLDDRVEGRPEEEAPDVLSIELEVEATLDDAAGLDGMVDCKVELLESAELVGLLVEDPVFGIKLELLD